MKALVAADEPAKDMAGAEGLLQRHRERKGEIDANEDSFKATSQFGQSLISVGHFASEEIKKKVKPLRHVLGGVQYTVLNCVCVCLNQTVAVPHNREDFTLKSVGRKKYTF